MSGAGSNTSAIDAGLPGQPAPASVLNDHHKAAPRLSTLVRHKKLVLTVALVLVAGAATLAAVLLWPRSKDCSYTVFTTLAFTATRPVAGPALTDLLEPVDITAGVRFVELFRLRRCNTKHAVTQGVCMFSTVFDQEKDAQLFAAETMSMQFDAAVGMVRTEHFNLSHVPVLTWRNLSMPPQSDIVAGGAPQHASLLGLSLQSPPHVLHTCGNVEPALPGHSVGHRSRHAHRHDQTGQATAGAGAGASASAGAPSNAHSLAASRIHHRAWTKAASPRGPPASTWRHLATAATAAAPSGFRVCFSETERSSQCQGPAFTCSDFSGVSADPQWTEPFRDDTDRRSGGCHYQWRIDAAPTQLPFTQHRLCFREEEGSSQCQGIRASCTQWAAPGRASFTAPFRDDTDRRSGGCRYKWRIESRVVPGVPAGTDAHTCPAVTDGVTVDPEVLAQQTCRVCFKETEGSSQCQGHRESCSGFTSLVAAAAAADDDQWLSTATLPFRDDTDRRSGGCVYQWAFECTVAAAVRRLQYTNPAALTVPPAQPRPCFAWRTADVLGDSDDTALRVRWPFGLVELPFPGTVRMGARGNGTADVHGHQHFAGVVVHLDGVKAADAATTDTTTTTAWPAGSTHVLAVAPTAPHVTVHMSVSGAPVDPSAYVCGPAAHSAKAAPRFPAYFDDSGAGTTWAVAAPPAGHFYTVSWPRRAGAARAGFRVTRAEDGVLVWETSPTVSMQPPSTCVFGAVQVHLDTPAAVDGATGWHSAFAQVELHAHPLADAADKCGPFAPGTRVVTLCGASSTTPVRLSAATRESVWVVSPGFGTHSAPAHRSCAVDVDAVGADVHVHWRYLGWGGDNPNCVADRNHVRVFDKRYCGAGVPDAATGGPSVTIRMEGTADAAPAHGHGLAVLVQAMPGGATAADAMAMADSAAAPRQYDSSGETTVGVDDCPYDYEELQCEYCGQPFCEPAPRLAWAALGVVVALVRLIIRC